MTNPSTDLLKAQAEAKITVGNTNWPVSELLKPCLPDLEPCNKRMWEHLNEEIIEALTLARTEGENALRSRILNLVLDDVPHQYQKRLLEALK